MPSNKSGVCVNLSSISTKRSKNGESIGTWAQVTSIKSVASCKYCPESKISFAKGAGALIRHSETPKHVNNVAESLSLEKRPLVQPTLEENLTQRQAEVEIKERAKELEIKMVRWAGRHEIAFKSLECLVDILKSSCPDSDVITKVGVSEGKARYLASWGIGDTYLNETIQLLRECDRFSLGFDGRR